MSLPAPPPVGTRIVLTVNHAAQFTIAGEYLGTDHGRWEVETEQRGFKQLWKVAVGNIEGWIVEVEQED